MDRRLRPTSITHGTEPVETETLTPILRTEETRHATSSFFSRQIYFSLQVTYQEQEWRNFTTLSRKSVVFLPRLHPVTGGYRSPKPDGVRCVRERMSQLVTPTQTDTVQDVSSRVSLGPTVHDRRLFGVWSTLRTPLY